MRTTIIIKHEDKASLIDAIGRVLDLVRYNHIDASGTYSRNIVAIPSAIPPAVPPPNTAPAPVKPEETLVSYSMTTEE